MKKALIAILFMAGFCAQAHKIWLEEITDSSSAMRAHRQPMIGRSTDGGLLSLGGKTYERGLGTHAPTSLVVPLGGRAISFEATVGIDDEMSKRTKASVEFKVWADGKLAATSGMLRKRKRTAELKVDLRGVKMVMLEVTDAGDGNDSDHADWANAFFELQEGAKLPKASEMTRQLGVLTPKSAAEPRVNGAGRIGVRPGSPVIYRVPVSGERPMKISVAGLPPGTYFDEAASCVRGAVARAGVYPLVITAENAKGKATRTVELVIGEKIALTPPMGWNSWNVFGGKVDEAKIKAATDAMESSGLTEHGWCYVNIDDFWQNRPGETTDKTLMGAVRAADGTINSNARFPSMKALADYIHSKGLRAGLYSSPGRTTCGGCEGSWMHEVQDAKTYADWGYDYLKYDRCSYDKITLWQGLDRERLPYLLMGKALRDQNRDILFSLCQYGSMNVSSWGETVLGSCWRTTGDVFDNWASIYGSIQKQAEVWPWSKPGAWNDPDMLCIGKVRWNGFKGSRLTPNEQYTHMSMWCMVASPLMIGCDMTQFDEFTLGLLANDEVLAIDQDELGLGAAKIQEGHMNEVWARPMSDGSVAVALLNANLIEEEVMFDMVSAGLEGGWCVRDVWRQADEGEVRGVYKMSVPGHATHLVRMRPARDGRLRRGMTDVRENAWRRQIELKRAIVPINSDADDDSCMSCKERKMAVNQFDGDASGLTAGRQK